MSNGEFARRRDFAGDWFTRKAVCKRCHIVIRDCEPMSGYGEFYHPMVQRKGSSRVCQNAGKTFNMQSFELEPFLRKRNRRHGREYIE